MKNRNNRPLSRDEMRELYSIGAEMIRLCIADGSDLSYFSSLTARATAILSDPPPMTPEEAERHKAEFPFEPI